MLDYIIVGGGIAGIAFAEKLRTARKSFIMIDRAEQTASLVASGIYNPIVLKRLKMVQNAASYLAAMHLFFDDLQQQFGEDLRTPISIWRKLASIEEQNDWFVAAELYSQFLVSEVFPNKNPAIGAPLGFGKVENTGWVNTKRLLELYHQLLSDSGLLARQIFHYDQVRFVDGGVKYGSYWAKNILFADGTGLLRNALFNYLPLEKTKGELLTIYAPSLALNQMINGGVFLMPLGDDYYKVGATYQRDDLSEDTTEQATLELTAKLATIIKVPYSIVQQEAGFRPTVIDRKPLIGTHPNYQCAHVLNGLGSRGIMLAPLCAKWLFDSIEFGEPIPASIHARRFDHLYKTRHQNQ